MAVTAHHFDIKLGHFHPRIPLLFCHRESFLNLPAEATKVDKRRAVYWTIFVVFFFDVLTGEQKNSKFSIYCGL